MCMIVDANRLGDFLADPAKPDVAPVRKWLDRGAGRIVYSTGRAFAREIGRRHRVRLQIIDRPRGKVYSSAANAGLLDRAVCGRVMD